MTMSFALACPADRFRELLKQGRDGDLAVLRRLADHDLSVGQLGRLSTAIAIHLDDLRREAGMLTFRLKMNLVPASALVERQTSR